jgi:Uma2 family endonuclease
LYWIRIVAETKEAAWNQPDVAAGGKIKDDKCKSDQETPMKLTEIDSPLVLGPELNGTLMTPREFDAVEECDENWVYELIHGVLVVSPPPLESERGPNEKLGYWLLLYQEYHRKGKTLDATLPEQYVRTPGNRRRADRVIWAGLGRQPNARKDKPTIVVEFVSAGKRSRRRDYEEKRKEYLAAGVLEYWIVDRFRRIMTVFRRGQPEHIIQENKMYRTQLLPGFELSLSHLLAVADQWRTKQP